MSTFPADLDERVTMAELRPILDRFEIRTRAKWEAIRAIELELAASAQPGRIMRYVLDDLPARTVKMWARDVGCRIYGDKDEATRGLCSYYSRRAKDAGRDTAAPPPRIPEMVNPTARSARLPPFLVPLMRPSTPAWAQIPPPSALGSPASSPDDHLTSSPPAVPALRSPPSAQAELAAEVETPPQLPAPFRSPGASLVGFFGCHNTGRSTLINELVGGAPLIATPRRDPQVAVQVAWASVPGVRVYKHDSVTELEPWQSRAAMEEAERNSKEVDVVRLEQTFRALDRQDALLEFIDTPALDPVNGTHEAAHAWLEHVDACVVVLPHGRGFGEHEIRFLDAWCERPRPIAIVTTSASLLWLSEPDTLGGGSVDGALRERTDAINEEMRRRSRLDADVQRFVENVFIGAVCLAGSRRYVPDAFLDTLGTRDADLTRFRHWLRRVSPLASMKNGVIR